MPIGPFTLQEDYWEAFVLEQEDIEFIYNYLLESETPLTNHELVDILVTERIQREKRSIEKKRSSGGDIYLPKNRFIKNNTLVFPALSWRSGKVTGVRQGKNPDYDDFEVIQVEFENGESHEYASGLENHMLNNPPEIVEDDPALNLESVLYIYKDVIAERMQSGLEEIEDFVNIAGRWFPRALLVDINVGHLNLAEAVLDMAGGGPLPTSALLEQLDLPTDVNSKLLEFSLDFALQEDLRFDEVGSSGEVLWFLQRLEPEEVKEPPICLRYSGMDYDREKLTEEMLALEKELDDELSPASTKYQHLSEVDVCLIFPHWRMGTLPLSARTRHLFPTAYESPRIRFMIVDGLSGERFPAWVVRNKRYVFGLRNWYEKCGLLPGSIVHVRQGQKPGEVIIRCDSKRPSRDWVRTVLVGSDGGIVFAMLKQMISSSFDERMAVAIPDVEAIDQVWDRMQKDHPPFEKIIVNIVRELTKLNPQSHVHASELYAAVNVIKRCPPGPIFELLASRPWFVHVGDLHFRFNDSELTG